MYCNKNKISWEEHDKLRECVKSFISEERYIHTLGVEQESAKIAEIFECEPMLVKKIKSAALLHDITKEFSREKQLEICEKYKIALSGDDMRVEKEWHAKTAAYIARCEFGADDTIFHAIYYHTFGASYKSFDLASKIIYLADWIEPERLFKDCVDTREYFYTNLENTENLGDKYKVLDRTILFAFDKTVQILLNEGLFMHKNTVENRNTFIQLYN
jgi:predicted HD superfamily hydrolase involved in NAD metabolism